MEINIKDLHNYDLMVDINNSLFNKQTWVLYLNTDKGEPINIIKRVDGIKNVTDKDPFCYLIYERGCKYIPDSLDYSKIPEDFRALIDYIQEQINKDQIEYTSSTDEDKIRIHEEIKKKEEEEWNKRPWYKKIIAPSD